MFGDYATNKILEVLKNIVKVGTVSSQNPSSGTVRVTFPDKDSMVSFELPIVVRQTMKNKDYYMPDIGEQVLCLFLPIGIQAGFVLGSFYSARDKPPVLDPDKRHILFEDESYVEYDRKEHKMLVKAPLIVVDGDINIRGNLWVQEKVHAKRSEFEYESIASPHVNVIPPPGNQPPDPR